MEENFTPQKENIGDVLKRFKEQQNKSNQQTNINKGNENISTHPQVEKMVTNQQQIQREMENALSKETDPDLLISYEIVYLPSKGIFYDNGLAEVNVEYMTSEDEDLLTTPSLIESGVVLDKLLARKIKTKGVNPKNLLAGDRNAIILFLRTSSYGTDYNVEVTDPRDNSTFKTVVDLMNLKYKELTEHPNENGYFNVELPMRKKIVEFKLLTVGEDDIIFKQAKAQQDAYNLDYSPYSTMKLKASVVSIDGNNDRDYINKFITAMPARDAFAIRKKILDVSPDVDMTYKFKAPDGFEFEATLAVGLDFFSPST